MARVVVLDDWRGIARKSADWSALMSRSEVVFFEQPFLSEDDAAALLADFDIVLSMRERTALPGSLIARLPRLRMLGITGRHNRTLDLAACTARKIVVSNTVGDDRHRMATAALIAALQVGRIAAGLDVYDCEPLPAEHPLRRARNVVLTPHLGFSVEETWREYYPQSVENALAFLDGKPLRVVNPEVL